MLGETVKIHRDTPGGIDPRTGDPKPPSSGETIEIHGCAVAPRISQGGEATDRGRAGVVVGLTLYAPAGAPIVRRTDQIEVRGEIYEVEGEPGLWVSPYSTRARGTEVALRRANG